MNNTALITGASSGIGREFCRIHAGNGGDLVMVARSRDKMEQLKTELESEHGIKVMIIVKDLSHPEAPREVYDEVKKAGVEIEYLINNAGFGGRGKFYERDWEKDRNMIHVNILALTALTRFFLPDFVSKNSGKILNVSSTASFLPGPLQAVYYATKAYVTFFSNALAEELHNTKITVTNLMPGPTESGFARVSGMDKTSIFDSTIGARKVAKDGYKGMMKGKLDVITGLPFHQKLALFMAPLIPKRMLLKEIRQRQEV